ncbi:unnamed protein product, partial [Trichobilharzia regenti]
MSNNLCTERYPDTDYSRFVRAWDSPSAVTINPFRVSSLRNVLAHDFDLPLNKQILLVSGGFQLEPGDKLSTYGAGLVSSIRHISEFMMYTDGGYPRQLASLLELAPSEKVFEDRLRLIRALTPIGREAANAIE